MLTTHAVGIDLGTTYSCIAYLNEHGEPVTLPNQEGELATPSVVLIEEGETIVGTEALRNAIRRPDRVVQNSKRFMGDPAKRWVIDGRPYTPIDIATVILKKLLSAAQEQIGSIEHAVITVPAQFSEAQRHATVEAGHRAGLQRVDIINEPVAAALCYVLGSEGLWFTELADEQRILVYDLGGGTFDLSLVRYCKNEVTVLCSSGDLKLGGIDWNETLLTAIAEQFAKEFGIDPRGDAESLQALALEVEQAKRSLSVRPRTALTCQHAGHRKTYQVEQEQFEKLTRPLVDRTAGITKRLLKDHRLGWAHVDVVLTTGGASRMPMVRQTLKKMSGTTLNTSLSPDLSIAHGATYYAGMLLTNSKFARSILNEKAAERLAQVKQRSVNARGLGILVRDTASGKRFPHYLIPANTPLPAAITQTFGTVVPNQRRVHLQIVESGTSPEAPPAVLGSCIINDLPPNLPAASEVAVTISYDEQARVHVEAKDVASGKEARIELIRSESVVPQLASEQKPETGFSLGASEIIEAAPSAKPSPAASRPATSPPRPTDPPAARPAPARQTVPYGVGGPDLNALEDADRPVPLCNECGEPLGARGQCPKCGPAAAPKTRPKPTKASANSAPSPRPKPRAVPPAGAAPRQPQASRRPASPPVSADDEILELDAGTAARRPAKRKPRDPGEEDFWQFTE